MSIGLQTAAIAVLLLNAAEVDICLRFWRHIDEAKIDDVYVSSADCERLLGDRVNREKAENECMTDSTEPSKLSPTQRIKFSDTQIDGMFRLVNDALFELGFGGRVLKPIVRSMKFWDPATRSYSKPAAKLLAELKAEGVLEGTDVNALGKISCGSAYDKKTMEQRRSEGEARVKKIVAAANDVLQKSNDSLFASLKCTLKNAKLEVFVEKEDKHDDGNDSYGMEFWLKFSFA